MSCLVLKIVDINNNNEIVEIDDLSEFGISDAIYQCDRLKDELEDAREKMEL